MNNFSELYTLICLEKHYYDFVHHKYYYDKENQRKYFELYRIICEKIENLESIIKEESRTINGAKMDKEDAE